MAEFHLDAFVRTTMGAARQSADGSSITPAQMEEVIAYLKSPGSGPDSATSFAEYTEAKLRNHPPELPRNVDYIAFSGTDRAGNSNYDNAQRHARNAGGSAGIIGDTPYGRSISLSVADPEFKQMASGLQDFMEAQGTYPMKKNFKGALEDILWNAGSPAYMDNAIARGKPILALVDGAPKDRGYSNHELPRAVLHPDSHMNGYPMRAFGEDALSFAGNSAFEYQSLERTLSGAASFNGSKMVTIDEIQNRLQPFRGYDPVKQTLFNRPIKDFTALTMDEMLQTRAQYMSAAEHLSPALKAGGVAGLALLAHDLGTSGHKWVELHSQGNAAGSYSTAAHFVGRNVGGAFGGFVAGAGVGLTTGSWTGPGAIITGIGGGALGAYLGERWADQKDIDHIYKQEDALGRTWTRNPADPEGRWMRGAHQQQVQGSDLGTGSEVRPVQTALGDDVTFRADYVATGTLERQLNWQAARASYELGLSNPPAPKDPYRLSAASMDGPRGAFETGRDFVRDPRTQQWELEIRETVDGRAATARHEPVSAERALALDEQSRAVIAQNAANTPAAMASRYMVAYEQGRWSDFGDKDNPSIPTAIQNARDSADTLVASDGDTYTRQVDGQWIHNGTFLDVSADANLRQELETTWKSQQAGVEELGAVAAEARATTLIPNEGVRGQVDALYAKHGIQRTEEQLAATATAVQQSLGSDGQLTDLTLELVPDARTRQPSADSAIAAFADPGNNVLELRGTTTPQDVAQVLAQQSLQNLGTAPLPDSPELRINALSPEQWDAHQQALREANRQGASTEEAIHAATLAAQQAGSARPGPAQEPQREAEPQRTPVGPAPEPVTPQAGTITMAAAQATAIPAAAAPPEHPRNTPQPSTQEQARAEHERMRQEEAKTTQRDASAQQAESRREPPAREQQPVAEETRVQSTQAAPLPQPTLTPSTQPSMEPPATVKPLPEEAVRATEPVPPQPAPIGAAPVHARDHDEAHREQTRLAEDRAFEAAPVRQPEPASQPIRFAPEAEEAREPRRFEQPAEPTHAPPQPPLLTDPRDPEHPDHRLYQQVREHVERLDARHGRQYDELSDRLTGSLMVLARSNGLSSVDHVVLSQATPNAKAGDNVFVVQGELHNPAHLRAAMQTEQAVTAPFEQSQQKLEALAQQHQSKEQALVNQQQETNERTQRESNPAMRM